MTDRYFPIANELYLELRRIYAVAQLLYESAHLEGVGIPDEVGGAVESIAIMAGHAVKNVGSRL